MLSSYTNNAKIIPIMCPRSSLTVRLILAKGVCVIWFETLYHSSAKYRNLPDPQEDMIFSHIFDYLYRMTHIL